MTLPPMSQRIVEYAGDDLPPPDDVEQYLEVLKFAQMAWNYAVVPPDSDAARIVERGILKLPPLARATLHGRLIEWVDRKKKLFPEDRRIIAQLRIKDSKRRLTVEAASYDYDRPREKRPNKAPEPTPRPVTIPAEPGIAPGRVVAHL